MEIYARYRKIPGDRTLKTEKDMGDLLVESIVNFRESCKAYEMIMNTYVVKITNLELRKYYEDQITALHAAALELDDHENYISTMSYS